MIRRRTKWGIGLTLLALLSGTVALVAHVVGHGFSARDQPTATEKFVARTLRHFSIPRGAREMKNPVDASAEVLSEAREHFADHCALCHGNDGRGDTELGRNLYPKAPDMRAEETKSLSDGELFYIIENGLRLTGMPAWSTGKPEDSLSSWKLVHFIRHLAAMTPDEAEQMKGWNPVSPKEVEERKAAEDFLNGEDEGEVERKPSPHVEAK